MSYGRRDNTTAAQLDNRLRYQPHSLVAKRKAERIDLHFSSFRHPHEPTIFRAGGERSTIRTKPSGHKNGTNLLVHPQDMRTL